MEAAPKTVWLVGKKLQDEEIKNNLELEGYTVRSFYPGKFSLIDDQPNLVIFSEAELKGFEILVKLRNFYPGTTIMSLPEAQIEKMIQRAPEKSHERVPKSAQEDDFQTSVNRLISSLQKIEADEQD